MMQERKANYSSGFTMLTVGLIILAGSIFLFIQARDLGAVAGVTAILGVIVSAFLFGGLFVVHPNQYKALQLFGSYVGTAKDTGLQWANPFYASTRVSVRVRNFETGKLKVNDASGIPIEIAAVGMVDQALERLKDLDVIELDEERKATMVSNLLVVLCSDRPVQPVVNAGSLYQ